MLRHALRADLPRVVDTWIEAFDRDPFFRWIAPDDEVFEPFVTEWFSMIAVLCFERGHTFVADDAAIAWVPPDVALVGPDDVKRAQDILVAHAGEKRAVKAFEVILDARGHALEEPHWTLQYVGVRRGYQGFGLGAAVVKMGLGVVDTDGLPCGLTSTNDRNLTFYKRLGFEVTAELEVPGGAAALRPMVRPARAHDR